MQEIEKRCYGEQVVSNCIREIFTRQKLDWRESESYIFGKFNRQPGTFKENSWNYTTLQDESVTSDFFDQEIEYYDRYGSKLWPAVIINNQTFRGQLEVEAVMNGICAGFAEAPKMCRRVLESGNTEDPSIIFDFD
jgi:hypothetical protein